MTSTLKSIGSSGCSGIPNSGEDCCHWSGVECDNSGHVVGLDLSDDIYIVGLNDSSSLFRLQFLQRVNLVGAQLLTLPSRTELPSGFATD